MSVFREGSVGYLTSTSSKRPFTANGNKYSMDEPLYCYVGLQQGVGVVHHIFRSIRGGYLVSVANVDFIIGDVEFTEDGKATRKPKRGKSQKVHPECTHRAAFSDPFLNVYNKGGWVA